MNDAIGGKSVQMAFTWLNNIQKVSRRVESLAMASWLFFSFLIEYCTCINEGEDSLQTFTEIKNIWGYVRL